MMTHWPRPDFLVRPTRRPVVVWAFAFCAIVSAALATRDWMAATRERDVQRERLSRGVDHAPAVRPAIRPVAPDGVVASADALRAAQLVVDRLDHPWDRILANVEAETPDGVQWLQLDHDAGDTTLSLDGTAGDVRTVLQLVDNLSDRPGWSDVVLGRLRTVDAHELATKAALWRFELHATVDAHRIAKTRRRGEL